MANYRKLQQEINLAALNRLLEMNSSPSHGELLESARTNNENGPKSRRKLVQRLQNTNNWTRNIHSNMIFDSGEGGFEEGGIEHSNWMKPKMANQIDSEPLEDCPEVPTKLMGRIFADINHTHDDNYTEESILSANPETRPGGLWMPSDCYPRHHVALIIPFRDRHPHLMVLLAHLHPVLQRQQIHYRIYVVEQVGVPYEELVGGVFAIKTEHFFKVNGYSNLYWGWGAEDDDMAYRLQHVGLKITRPPSQVARYKMIRHTKRPAVDGRIRYRLLWTGVRRYKIDGLNSLSSLNYNVVFIKDRPLFTHIMVNIGPPPPGF